jgi:hypothetical protein
MLQVVYLFFDSILLVSLNWKNVLMLELLDSI